MSKKNNYSRMVETRKKCSAEKLERIEIAIKTIQATRGEVTAKRVAEAANVSLALVYKSDAYKAVASNTVTDARRTIDSNAVMNSILTQELDRKNLQCNYLREENKRLKEERQSLRSEIKMLKNQLKVQGMDKLAEEFDEL